MLIRLKAMKEGGGGGFLKYRIEYRRRVVRIMLTIGIKKKPTATGRSKYNEDSWVVGQEAFKALDLPEEVKDQAVKMANAGLSDGTKAQYQAAWNLARKAEEAMGETFEMPWTPRTTIMFVVYARQKHWPRLKASTIKAYLAGVRMQHLMRGYMVGGLKPDIVKLMVSGAENLDAIQARLEEKKPRQAITWDLLKRIKERLFEVKGSKVWKTAVWLTCSLAFNGSFRVHEILARQKMTFSTSTDLLGKSVRMRSWENGGRIKTCLEVNLSHPKEARLSQGVKVDVFEIKGAESWACPVRAFRAYTSTGCQGDDDSPLIRCADGQNYTGTTFNKDLKFLLDGVVDYREGTVTSHSFRAGLATWMAKAGYSDEEIMLTGRWKSGAFLNYVKTPRTARATQAEELVSRLANVAI